jgi:transposase InsO family protein
MTKSSKRNRPKDIKKHNDDLRKKRREDHYQKKRFLVAEHRSEGRSVRWIAERITMSVGFVHKWCMRLDEHIRTRRKRIRTGERAEYPRGEGIRDAVRSRSTAPKNPRRKITAKHREMIRALRKGKYTRRMGAQKIEVHLDMDISHQSINKILKEEGLTAPRKKRKQRKFNPFRRPHSNDLWQMDYKEFEKGIYKLSVKDDHSSAILAADVRPTWSTDDVKDIVGKAVGLFGRPRQILSDHGTQFTSMRGKDNHGFEKWCSDNGIEHIMGKVRKPTTQGKIERWNGTVLEEAQLPPKGSSAEEYRRAVLEFTEFYNNERPHHGIDLRVPMIVYMAGIKLPDILSELGVHEVP